MAALALGALILLSPLGLIVARHFKAGAAWGEWDTGQVTAQVGYAPRGMERLGGTWKAPLAGYVGINAAALLTGVEFGLQPLLHHTADGQALYSPYGLRVAVAAMSGEHLLVFGWVEAIVTALVVKYLQRQAPELLEGEARP